ncbi:MAG: hypothetical protein MR878_02125 [Campylobacter sp.]|nr:hypothetical protein [Campylobacter sp.]
MANFIDIIYKDKLYLYKAIFGVFSPFFVNKKIVNFYVFIKRKNQHTN